MATIFILCTGSTTFSKTLNKQTLTIKTLFTVFCYIERCIVSQLFYCYAECCNSECPGTFVSSDWSLGSSTWLIGEDEVRVELCVS